MNVESFYSSTEFVNSSAAHLLYTEHKPQAQHFFFTVLTRKYPTSLGSSQAKVSISMVAVASYPCSYQEIIINSVYTLSCQINKRKKKRKIHWHDCSFISLNAKETISQHNSIPIPQPPKDTFSRSTNICSSQFGCGLSCICCITVRKRLGLCL